MKKNSVPVASLPGADAPSKTQDDREFMHKWIAFGMMLKGKADGYGVDWRKMSFEKWMSEITFADVFAETKEEECAM